MPRLVPGTDAVPPGVAAALRTLGRDLWSVDAKASEDVVPPIFDNFYQLLGLRNEMAKADHHQLVACLEPGEVDPEIASVLDHLAASLARA